jgi:hypothetical protein
MNYIILILLIVVHLIYNFYFVKSLVHTDIAKACDKEMTVVLNDKEYVCMKVPSEGLATTHEELIRIK